MQETVAAGAPATSPMKKPSGSTAAKQASSAKPGFQPSAAAQLTAVEISSGRIGRMRKPFMAGDRTDGLMLVIPRRNSSAHSAPVTQSETSAYVLGLRS